MAYNADRKLDRSRVERSSGDYAMTKEWVDELISLGAKKPGFECKFLLSISRWNEKYNGVTPRQNEALKNIERLLRR